MVDHGVIPTVWCVIQMVTDFNWILEKPVSWVTLAQFNSMLEYSTSLPTGKTIGKRWKRQILYGPHKGRWLMGEYAKDPDPEYVKINWYRIACAGDELPPIEDPQQPWRKPLFSAWGS